MLPLTLLFIGTFFGTALGHGRLAHPPGRSSAWKFGYGTPVHLNDWQLNCGGYDVRILSLFARSVSFRFDDLFLSSTIWRWAANAVSVAIRSMDLV